MTAPEKKKRKKTPDEIAEEQERLFNEEFGEEWTEGDYNPHDRNADAYFAQGRTIETTQYSDDSDNEGAQVEEEQPRQKRAKIANHQAVVQTIQYLPGGLPHYTPDGRAGSGGCLSTATLGPAGNLSVDSDSVAAALPNLALAKLAHPQYYFVAGHLLNAVFGGAGDDADNLTILTQSANGQHKAFDQPVKKAVDELRKAYLALSKIGIDVAQLGYGISVTVATTGAFWSNTATEPAYFITTALNCQATVVAEPTQTTLAGAVQVNHYQARLDEAEDAIAAVRAQVALANASGNVPNARNTG
ncbi:MAG TPA: hypothetical protein VFW65_03765 [Pseudonocardiaceae bacterium]|nr:hypothetical protein [Pseudonocardiaceae bacterium]